MLDAFADFLRENDCRPATVTGYLADLTDFARWFEQANGQTLAPERLTPSDVREYRQHLLSTRKLKPNTVNRRLASLSAYARWAKVCGRIQADPTARIQPVPHVENGPRWLDKPQRFALQRAVEQALQLAASCSEARRSLWRVRDAVLLVAMLNTGLRVSEVVGLDVDDLALKPRSGSLQTVGKGGKQRSVPLNVEARDALERWLALRPQTDSPAVFVSQVLQRMTARSVERVVAEYGRVARIEGLTPHVLRHSFAKSLVDRGVPLDQVATLLGHSNLNTTRLYTTPGERDLERAVEALLDK